MLDVERKQARGRGRRATAAADGVPALSGRGAAAKGAEAAVVADDLATGRGRGGSIGRPVDARLSARRLLLACGLVLLLPGALAVAALGQQQPEAAPAESAASLPVLAQVPDRVLRTELDRSQAVNRLTGKLAAPTLLAAVGADGGGPGALPTFEPTGATPPLLALTGGALPTLALTPRPDPYSLDELHRLVPAAFSDLVGRPGDVSPLLLMANLQVPLGASLIIDGRTPDVRLTSSPAGFATIISRGTVTVTGSRTRPVRISSWDPGRGRVDRDPTDGRSFILQMGGRMDADHAVFEYLGFNLGLSSGVSWNGAPATSTRPESLGRGEVRSSVFRHNYFGAYTSKTDGMQWVGNTFADNDQYGFDPHTFSNNFLVEANVAFGNGKHGFIFSRGCTHNIIRGNVAHHNAGHGFMIDDGRSRPSTQIESRVNGSSNNVLVDNSAFGNGGNGIEIEGGIQNVVENNRVSGNFIGIQIKDNAMAVVRDNTLKNNVKYGIDIRNATGGIPVAGNTVTGGWAAVNLTNSDSATLSANVSSNVSTPLVVAGAAIRDISWPSRVVQLVRWNPMLVLWSVLLGVPIAVVVVRRCWTAARPRRRISIA